MNWERFGAIAGAIGAAAGVAGVVLAYLSFQPIQATPTPSTAPQAPTSTRPSSWSDPTPADVPASTDAREMGTSSFLRATPVGQRAAGLVVDTQRQRIHVAAGGKLISLDSSGTPIGRPIPVDPHATGVALDGKTGDVFVLAGRSHKLFSVDLDARRVSESVTAGGEGGGGSIVNPVLDEIYVSNNEKGFVEIFRASTLERLATVDCGPSPRGLAINPQGDTLFVANATEPGSVTALDIRNRTAAASIPVGNAPVGLAYDPSTQRLYVTNSASNSVSVIDEDEDRVIGTIQVGQSPLGIALAGSGRIYVGNQQDDSVTVIDGSSAITTITDAGDGPQQVRFDESTKRLFVSSWGSGQVRIWQLS